MRPILRVSIILLFGAVMLGCDQSGNTPVQAAQPIVNTTPVVVAEEIPDSEPVIWLDGSSDADVKEIEWDTLIPEDWQPATLMSDYDIANLSDNDPRAQELLKKLKALWDEAPVVPTLEGQRVRLPGFVVPLEMDAEKIDQFLLVPYYGACIHVPPPPANQTVHVVTLEDKAFEGGLFDVVWVTGTMRVERSSSDLAVAGYRLEEASTVPYD